MAVRGAEGLAAAVVVSVVAALQEVGDAVFRRITETNQRCD